MVLAAAAAAKLAFFAPLVGGCWSADITATVRDTHCFEAMYDGAHIRDRHEVRASGAVVYAGETIYSVDSEQIVFTYVNSTGGVGHGTLRSERGRNARFSGNMRGSPQSKLQPIDSEWRIVDANHYEVRSLMRLKDGKVTKPLTFTRVSEAKPK